MFAAFKIISFILAMLAAGAAQNICAFNCAEAVPVHVPFLLALTAYTALTRPAAPAMAMILGVGLLTDVLAGLPMMCTLSFNLIIWLGLVILKHSTAHSLATICGGLAICAVLAPLQTVWVYFWLEDLSGWLTWPRLGCSALAGILAGAVVFTAGVLCDPLNKKREPQIARSDDVFIDA